ncbi:hypothetical protein GGI12_004078 [Dipsacomyces acuminosporus]|nr:hypothetical protein GGI12_004078 [Dipsacomyces acuminosporus]
MDEQGAPVQLYLYDLSQGMAKQLSVAMTGRYFEAIWHSSIVVYGTEYFYGQGIMAAVAGRTMHGSPLEVVDLGPTYLPKDVVHDYVNGMRQEFTPEKYHLLKFNCNTFSAELAKALTGSSIPDKVANLPDDFIDTPFGKQFLPMIESFYGQSARSIPATDSNAATATAAAATAPLPPPSQQATSKLDYTKVQSVASLDDLQTKMKTHRAVVLYFTSFTCPPCRVIAPIYEEMVKDKNAELLAAGSDKHILGIKIDCSMQHNIAAPFNVRGTPTFMFYLDGQLLSQFSGANSAQLKSEVEFLCYSAFPPHPHTRLSLSGLNDVGMSYILFKYTAGSSLAPVFKRTRESLEKVEGAGAKDRLEALQADIESVLTGGMAAGQKDEKLAGIFQNLHEVYDLLPFADSFPVVDLVRMLVIEASSRSLGSSSSAKEKTGHHLVRSIVSDVAKHAGDTATALPKAISLLTLRLLCNLFSSAATANLAMSPAGDGIAADAPRLQTTELLVSSLLSADTSVRRTAASLAFNVAAYISRNRQQPSGETIDEDWLIELVSAISKGIEDQAGQLLGDKSNKAAELVQVLVRLMAALSHIVYMASELVVDLVKLLTVHDTLDAVSEHLKASSQEDQLFIRLASDIKKLLSSN